MNPATLELAVDAVIMVSLIAAVVVASVVEDGYAAFRRKEIGDRQ